MEGFLLLIGIVAAIILYFVFLAGYPEYLQEKRNCVPYSFGKISLTILILVLLLFLNGAADSLEIVFFSFLIILFSIILYALNFKAARSHLHAFIMLIWQFTIVVSVIILIIKLLDAVKRAKEEIKK